VQLAGFAGWLAEDNPATAGTFLILL